MLAPHPLPDLVLLRVVDGGDDLRFALPQVQELLLVVRGVDDLERLAEEAQQLVLPLEGQRRRNEDQAALDRLAELELLDEEAGHDRLARAGVVGEQEAQPRLRQHLAVDRFDLVRQGADAGEADRELAVVGVGEADSGGLDQEPQLLRVRGRGGRGLLRALSGRGDRCGNGRGNGRSLLGGDDRLLERAVGQPDAAFVAGGAVRAERPHVLQYDGRVEVPRQGDPASDQRGKRSLGHRSGSRSRSALRRPLTAPEGADRSGHPRPGVTAGNRQRRRQGVCGQIPAAPKAILSDHHCRGRRRRRTPHSRSPSAAPSPGRPRTDCVCACVPLACVPRALTDAADGP